MRCAMLVLGLFGLGGVCWGGNSAALAEGLQDQPHRERVIHLPEDGGTWWVTLCLPVNHHADSASRRLLVAMSTEPRLVSLKAQCKQHVFAANDPLFRARWAAHVGRLPAILVQQPDGRTCYKASAENIPPNAAALADEISAAIENCRPRPQPTPAPAPVTPAPTVRPIPDIRPTPSQTNSDGGLLLALLAGLGGAAGGLASEWKKSEAV